MKKTVLYLIFLFSVITYYSCNNSTIKTDNTIYTDSRFVGVWKYDASLDKDKSMAGITARLSKVEATNETYYFEYLGNEMMFSKKDDSTLTGIDNNFILHYDSDKGHLIIDGSHNLHSEFNKLK